MWWISSDLFTLFLWIGISTWTMDHLYSEAIVSDSGKTRKMWDVWQLYTDGQTIDQGMVRLLAWSQVLIQYQCSDCKVHPVRKLGLPTFLNLVVLPDSGQINLGSKTNLHRIICKQLATLVMKRMTHEKAGFTLAWQCEDDNVFVNVLIKYMKLWKFIQCKVKRYFWHTGFYLHVSIKNKYNLYQIQCF